MELDEVLHAGISALRQTYQNNKTMKKNHHGKNTSNGKNSMNENVNFQPSSVGSYGLALNPKP